MSEVKKKSLTEPTFTENLTTYFKGVRVEWDKITWPQRKQVGVEVVIVITVVLFFTLMIYIFDSLFGFLFGFLG